MQFTILDTEATYRRLLAAPGPAEREAIFRAEIVDPFAGLVKVFGGGDGLATFAQWHMTPEQFAPEHHADMRALIEALAAHDAWGQCAQALADAQAAFAPHAAQIALDTVVFGLLLGSMRGIPLQRGYTGFGGMPGYVMTVYAEANEYTLPRIKGTTVHELHHNLRFTLFPFSPFGTTVAEYMIAEGLAEAFSAELYGEDVVGFYVTDFDESRLEETRRVVGGALDVTGFNEIRAYIFGDTITRTTGGAPVGVPDYAGYAIGYRVVRQFLARTGASVAEATFLPARQIIAESGFFG